MRCLANQCNPAVAVLIGTLAMVCAPCPAAHFTPVAQDRSTYAFVETICEAPEEGGDVAAGFGPFESHVNIFQNCDMQNTYGWAIANQISQIGESSLSGSGDAFAAGDTPAALHAFSWSLYSVTFELSSASTFDLTGMITVEGGYPTAVYAQVRLTGPKGETIVDHDLVGDGGTLISEDIDDAGQLEPGQYALEATAAISAADLLQTIPPGEATFSFNLDVAQLGDVNGDETVNIDDLLAVISAWGECPQPPANCPADLNGDGAVDVGDLLLVIGNWG
ncbi:MAG: dockerin type I domain-containing protein [Phycisphaerales bacterium]|nr:dockerin type I domain-containing protein [Phycisphaerales bacterium]MCI0676904.1 dockerin type I domain-containing protein [Phycisphaerales bacterium]